METELSLKGMQSLWHGSKRSYVIGFIASILLTSVSFLLVSQELLPGETLIYVISGLAFTQAVVQLRYFLHLGQEESPQWESFVFFFMMVIMLIIVLGSLWIMNDLNDRMMVNHTEVMKHD